MPLIGPFGWPYPFVNLFLDLVNELKRGRGGARLTQGRISSPRPIISNLEEVTWTDWKGRDRKMSIHREVR